MTTMMMTGTTMATGSRLPARVRIMGWLVLLMLSVLTTVVLVIREYQLREIDDRVNRSLEQDAEEFRIYAGTGVNPVNGRVYDHRHELLEDHLRGQYTDTAEVLVGVREGADPLDKDVQGQPSSTKIPLTDDLLRQIMHDAATTGTVVTPGGEMRWVKVGCLPPTPRRTPDRARG
jgi:two-component system, OmpR family, sensor kinase